MLPVDGFKVLDLTRMVLAELGADVIKVEQPGTGGDSRRLGPKINGESYPFAMPNRSKRSVSLDLKDGCGRDVFVGMAREADLIIEKLPRLTQPPRLTPPACRYLHGSPTGARVQGGK